MEKKKMQIPYFLLTMTLIITATLFLPLRPSGQAQYFIIGEEKFMESVNLELLAGEQKKITLEIQEPSKQTFLTLSGNTGNIELLYSDKTIYQGELTGNKLTTQDLSEEFNAACENYPCIIPLEIISEKDGSLTINNVIKNEIGDIPSPPEVPKIKEPEQIISTQEPPSVVEEDKISPLLIVGLGFLLVIIAVSIVLFIAKLKKPKKVQDTVVQNQINAPYRHLLDYINKHLSQGFTLDQIKNALINGGWHKNIVDETIDKILKK